MRMQELVLQLPSCQALVPPRAYRTHHRRVWHNEDAACTCHQPDTGAITKRSQYAWHRPSAVACAQATDSMDSTQHLLLRSSLPPPPVLQGSPQSMFNAVTLAFLGDAIWEALSRQHAWHVLQPPGQGTHKGSKQLHNLAVSKANAVQQAAYHDLLLAASPGSSAGEGAMVASSSNMSDSMHAAGRNSMASSGDNVSSSSNASSSQNTGSSSNYATSSSSNASSSNSVSSSSTASSGASTNNSSSGMLGSYGHTVVGMAARNSTDTLCLQPVQLSETELEVLRWARNSGSLTIPAGVHSLVYKKATALEALVAYLYLTDPKRCMQLTTALLESKAMAT